MIDSTIFTPLPTYIDGYTIYPSRLVGKGAQAVCFECTHQSIDVPLCVKILTLQSEEDISMCLKEQEVLDRIKSIDHPNLIKIFHIVQKNSYCYIFMRRYNRGNLLNYLDSLFQTNNRDRIVTCEFILNILTQVVEGYKVLFNNNIIHRDLKPENLLVDDDGFIKITDFGMGKIVKNPKSIIQQSAVGTPVFASPQILTLSSYSSSTDVFSFGVLIYYIIFNQFPLRAKNVEELAQLYVDLLNKKGQFFIPDISIFGSQQEKTIIKQFLQQSLQVEEKLRIAWPDLFNQFIEQNELLFKTDNEQIQKNIQTFQLSNTYLESKILQQNQVIQISGKEVNELITATDNGSLCLKNNLTQSTEMQLSPVDFETKPVKQDSKKLLSTIQSVVQSELEKSQPIFTPQQSTDCQQIVIFVKFLLNKIQLANNAAQSLSNFETKYRDQRKLIMLTNLYVKFQQLLLFYRFSLLSNLFEIVRNNKNLEENQVVRQIKRLGNLESQLQLYFVEKSQKVKEQKEIVSSLFEQCKKEYEQHIEIGYKCEPKTKFTLEYDKLQQEFHNFFRAWLFEQKSLMPIEVFLEFIAYSIKFSRVNVDYPIQNFKNSETMAQIPAGIPNLHNFISKNWIFK